MIICYHNTLSLIDAVYIIQFFGQLVTVKNVFVMVPIKMPVVLVEISKNKIKARFRVLYQSKN